MIEIAARRGASGVWSWLALAAVLGAVAVWLWLPTDEWLIAFRQWVRGFGAWGVAVFGAVYIAAALLLVPEAPLTVAAGVAFGAWGFPVVYGAAVAGAGLAFFVARHVVRERVAAWLERRPKLQAIDRAVAEGGWKVVALFRLSPVVPFNLQNYFFGITDISFPHYLAATCAGIIPGTAFYVYLGVLGMAASAGEAHGPFAWLLFGVGLVATAAAVALVARRARARLRDAGLDGNA